MSHVTKGAICYLDLDSAEEALAQFPGAHLRRGQQSYRWFGQFMNDWSSSRAVGRTGEINPASFGHCEHAIHVDGVEYEIGLQPAEGGGWNLVYDTWGPGRPLEALFGEGLCKLNATYAEIVLLKQYSAMGWQAQTWTDEQGRRHVTAVAQ